LVDEELSMDITTHAQGSCEHLLRAESFINSLLQQHFAKMADQCAVIVQQGCSDLPVRHAGAKVLGKIQVMRGQGEQYKRRVLANTDDLRGIPALRACLGYWIADLDELIECHAKASAKAPITSKDLAEEAYLLNSGLVRLFTEMRSTSTAWLAAQTS
jgi:hypothetical protein